MVQFIGNNTIAAKIDKANEMVELNLTNKRQQSYVQALTVCEEYVEFVSALLLRQSLVEHNFAVRAPRGLKGAAEIGNLGDYMQEGAQFRFPPPSTSSVVLSFISACCV